MSDTRFCIIMSMLCGVRAGQIDGTSGLIMALGGLLFVLYATYCLATGKK